MQSSLYIQPSQVEIVLAQTIPSIFLPLLTFANPFRPSKIEATSLSHLSKKSSIQCPSSKIFKSHLPDFMPLRPNKPRHFITPTLYNFVPLRPHQPRNFLMPTSLKFSNQFPHSRNLPCHQIKSTTELHTTSTSSIKPLPIAAFTQASKNFLTAESSLAVKQNPDTSSSRYFKCRILPKACSFKMAFHCHTLLLSEAKCVQHAPACSQKTVNLYKLISPGAFEIPLIERSSITTLNYAGSTIFSKKLNLPPWRVLLRKHSKYDC
ncbi:hypothetical protein BDY21DRAFT_199357 [Lineolata rhizophorae]|uniref:Uncharacterized protein n=1 Tax=Lineolata rhizophorae TaxID=578093 RepID=A0A6A6P4U6_9PEZI|nr:hypothetical protein BDY21DRAFT_199357 [Lineolata rhizophorae]